MKRATVGRRILISVAALTPVGGFLADWNRTHLFNPNWPPHAKFHDVQSILLGSLSGASGLYFLRGGRRGKEEGSCARGPAALPLLDRQEGRASPFPKPKGLRRSSQRRFPG